MLRARLFLRFFVKRFNTNCWHIAFMNFVDRYVVRVGTWSFYLITVAMTYERTHDPTQKLYDLWIM